MLVCLYGYFIVTSVCVFKCVFVLAGVNGGVYPGSWCLEQRIGQNTQTKQERMKQQKQRFIEMNVPSTVSKRA